MAKNDIKILSLDNKLAEKQAIRQMRMRCPILIFESRLIKDAEDEYDEPEYYDIDKESEIELSYENAKELLIRRIAAEIQPYEECEVYGEKDRITLFWDSPFLCSSWDVALPEALYGCMDGESFSVRRPATSDKRFLPQVFEDRIEYTEYIYPPSGKYGYYRER